MKWSKLPPEKEGWYFWRQSNKRNDPLLWETYYVFPDEEHEGKMTYMQDGTEIYSPKVGEWALIRLTEDNERSII